MRILVADDDIFFLKVVTDILAEAGHEVNTARSGVAALELAATIEPDLAILDVVMPDLRGTEVSQRIREEQKNRALPILLVSTGVGDLHDAGGDPQRYQADDFLHKPFNPEVLVARVQRLARLGKSRTRQHRHPTREIPAWTERRQHARVPVDAEVTARVESVFLHNAMVNISDGGVCIDPGHPLEAGSEIELRFALPGEQGGMVAAIGRVVWCQDVEDGIRWNAGVSFTRMPQDDAERVSAYTTGMQHVVERGGEPRTEVP